MDESERLPAKNASVVRRARGPLGEQNMKTSLFITGSALLTFWASAMLTQMVFRILLK